MRLLSYKWGKRLGQSVARVKTAASALVSAAKGMVRAVYARSDPPELEQGLIRLGFGLLVMILFWAFSTKDGNLSATETSVFAATVAYVLAAVAILARIVRKGGVSVLRRYVSMAVDMAGITYFMIMMGEDGAVMFG